MLWFYLASLLSLLFNITILFTLSFNALRMYIQNNTMKNYVSVYRLRWVSYLLNLTTNLPLLVIKLDN